MQKFMHNPHTTEFVRYSDDVAEELNIIRQDADRFSAFGVDHEFGQKLVDADYLGSVSEDD